MTATVTGFAIDTNAADIQPPGSSAAAGSTGQAADAGHVHPIGGLWPGTTLGDLSYGAAAGVQTRLAGNTTATRKFLRQQGTGSVSAVPAWDTLKTGDLPAGYGTSWINVTSVPYSADPSGSADSTSGINSALLGAAAFGASVYIPYGTYKTTAPLQAPPCVSIVTDGAQENTTYLDSSLGTIIRPAATWAQGSCPANAVIAVLGQTDATPNYAVPANDTKITGLYVDCHLLPAGLSSTDGIQLYGGVGRCHLERVLIGHAPNCGVNPVADGGGSSPGSFRLDRVTVRYAGQATSPAQGYGFWINKTSDVTLRDCLAENCSGDGYNIVNLSNGELVACRAEHNGTPGTGAGNATGNGFTYICTNSGTGSGTAKFIGCSSDRNQANGIEINSTNGSGVPVTLSGCQFRRDGQNSTVASPNGAGGNNFAGIYVHGFPGSVLIAGGTAVFPGVSDDGTGTSSPQIGARLASNNSGGSPNTYIAFGTSYIQGATTGISDDGSAQEVRYGPACIQATGTTGNPQVLGPRQGFATLSSGLVTVSSTLVASNSRIFLSYAKISGTPGYIDVDSRTAGTSFVIKSNTSAGATNTADNSGVYWQIDNP